ncbi:MULTISPECIES: zinc-ribbon and DUF3426 domain-containing protein [unclassified Desulfovibrio]|uniref:zinc-ribbon and DUF3426 domain-containing protein n=1 Tax=unclassified Desulfovibrio TaxID=2593640 RepID=UPI000F602453|nr:MULTISPECIES: zinc-ribbon and DUF3426 domain-containing protein [unclassified Desulfovibrio]RRD70742.1 DUF3426 domain-containing protein [Desulfovibrio sp. OH1209_COT-279]RRD87144.1 DUF3426 domain-containing protein [Desulfovibrio sp. OH1186_COT-070]
MEIQCPACSSRFHLPDNLVKPGIRLRCSVCKNVFAHEPAPVQESAPPAAASLPDLPARKRKNLVRILGACVLLLALGGGLWWWKSGAGSGEGASPGQEVARNVELLTMRNVRQYYVDNEKAGRVFVIEGRVVNGFPQSKDLIAIEAAIYDKDKKTLSAKRQLTGVQLSLFQLQVLSEKEMEALLNNKLEILTNNTNVPHGGESPFMILFYAPPEGVAEFGVRIVDAKDSPPAEGTPPARQ